MRNGRVHRLRSVIGLEIAQSAIGDHEGGSDGEGRLLSTRLA